MATTTATDMALQDLVSASFAMMDLLESDDIKEILKTWDNRQMEASTKLLDIFSQSANYTVHHLVVKKKPMDEKRVLALTRCMREFSTLILTKSYRPAVTGTDFEAKARRMLSKNWRATVRTLRTVTCTVSNVSMWILALHFALERFLVPVMRFRVQNFSKMDAISMAFSDVFLPILLGDTVEGTIMMLTVVAVVYRIASVNKYVLQVLIHLLRFLGPLLLPTLAYNGIFISPKVRFMIRWIQETCIISQFNPSDTEELNKLLHILTYTSTFFMSSTGEVIRAYHSSGIQDTIETGVSLLVKTWKVYFKHRSPIVYVPVGDGEKKVYQWVIPKVLLYTSFRQGLVTESMENLQKDVQINSEIGLDTGNLKAQILGKKVSDTAHRILDVITAYKFSGILTLLLGMGVIGVFQSLRESPGIKQHQCKLSTKTVNRFRYTTFTHEDFDKCIALLQECLKNDSLTSCDKLTKYRHKPTRKPAKKNKK